jgi:integrase
MASLRKKDGSPFWFGCFTLPDGTRTQRSTGTSDRSKALRIAHQFEDAAKEAAEGRFTEARARRTISAIYALASRDALASSSTADFLAAWLKRKELEAGEATHAKYTSVVKQFNRSLGSKAKRDIVQVTACDITKFRDQLADTLAPGTVNVALKIIRSAFAQAHRDGLIDANEAERVSTLKKPTRFERRPFSLPELKRILEPADDEWRGMILFGLYTGQRLGDIARLTWHNVDLQHSELRLTTEKTGRIQTLPLASPLRRFIEEKLPAGDKPGAPLFPRIYATAEKHKYIGNLSNQFYGILVSAGLALKKSHKSTGKGRNAKREQNALSFHSLRHTATSLLKRAGVSDAVAMEFIGHDSKSVSRHYTHIDTATLKAAADKLPDVLS